MTKQEFDNLAERVLLALLANSNSNAQLVEARQAVMLTDEFVKALNSRHADLASKKTTLTPEEINLLNAREFIAAIKSVRDRTNMDLKSAKDLVDKARADLGLI